ncbi:MAG: hypothetical protein L0Z62_04890 [Gemmataceae bacterium]|nr:hypothetical protein [Gemmataceae bacterium]
MAEAAARLMASMAPPTDAGRALAQFFADHVHILGHLSYLPDSSWRNTAEERRIYAMNSPNHYFGPERLLGAPPAPDGPAFQEYLAAVRRLPADYQELKQRYEGTDNALPGVPADSRKLRLYEDLGTTPWRAQELYDLLVEAFRCARQKEPQPQPAAANQIYPPAPSPFQLPADGIGENVEPLLPTYLCRPELPRRSDLHAAVVLAGVLAHFIGDQGQPYHPTADYDGWVTGNGGIHSYFEAHVVHYLDERLSADVLERAQSAEFQRRVWERVGTDLAARFGVAQLLIHLAADSISNKEAVRHLDDQVAVLKKSARLEWGDYPWRHPDQTFPEAERRPATSPEVSQAFRPLVVERLAVSAVILARLWLEAWKAAGEPSLAGVSSIGLPYPLDPPFIWPAFDPDALARSKQTERSSRYPAHWWQPLPEGEKQWWEIGPEEAGRGEVILSKRNELGVFSNFAHTPFYFHGQRYESVEGFWYMLAYPEGPEDPRLKHPGMEWKYTREQLPAMVGFDAKAAGELAEANMARMNINWVSFEGKRMPYWSKEKSEHYQLLRQVLWEKVRQNPDVRELLLATGDLVLKPDNFDSLRDLPAWRYFDLYAEIRHSLQTGDPGPPSARYPPHWWQPLPAGEKQWWEIGPEEAGPGEVIVSKRNELGILSNFAPTPFEFRGQRYASVEGFWQMLLYPEGPNDPRVLYPGLEWKFTREQVAQMTAFEAKDAGALAEANMKKMGIGWVTFEGRQMPYWTKEKGEHYRLIVAAMRAKLEQNTEVKQVLLATGDLILKPDHHQEAEASPAWFYNVIWMELRHELQEQRKPLSQP